MEPGNQEQLTRSIVAKKATAIKIDFAVQAVFIAVNIVIAVMGTMGLAAFALVPVYVFLLINFFKCKHSLAELGVKNKAYNIIGIVLSVTYLISFLLTMFLSW